MQLKPDWAKGYSRLGAAHHGLRAFDEVRHRRRSLAGPHARPLTRATQAVAAYQKGLELEPANETLKAGLADAQEAKARGRSDRSPPGFARQAALTRANVLHSGAQRAAAPWAASAACFRNQTLWPKS